MRYTTEPVYYHPTTEAYWLCFTLDETGGIQPKKALLDSKQSPAETTSWQDIPRPWPFHSSWLVRDAKTTEESEIRIIHTSDGKSCLLRRRETIQFKQPITEFSRFTASGWVKVNLSDPIIGQWSKFSDHDESQAPEPTLDVPEIQAPILTQPLTEMPTPDSTEPEPSLAAVPKDKISKEIKEPTQLISPPLENKVQEIKTSGPSIIAITTHYITTHQYSDFHEAYRLVRIPTNREETAERLQQACIKISSGLPNGQTIRLDNTPSHIAEELIAHLAENVTPENLHLRFINGAIHQEGIAILAKAIITGKFHKGLRLYFRNNNLPKEWGEPFKPLFAAICDSRAPENLTVHFQNTLSNSSLALFGPYLHRQASKNLTIIIEEPSLTSRHFETDGLQVLGKAIEEKRIPVGFQLHILNHGHSQTFKLQNIINYLAEDTQMTALTLPSIDAKQVSQLQEILTTNDSLLTVTFADNKLPQSAPEQINKVLLDLQLRLLSNRLFNLSRVLLPVLNVHFIPHLSELILQYVVEMETLQNVLGLTVNPCEEQRPAIALESIQSRDLIAEAVFAKTEAKQERYITICKKHPELTKTIWSKIIETTMRQMPTHKLEATNALLDDINKVSLYHLSLATEAKEKCTIIETAFTSMQSLMAVSPEFSRHLAAKISHLKITDEFTYHQLQILTHTARDYKIAVADPRSEYTQIMQLIMADPNYTKTKTKAKTQVQVLVSQMGKELAKPKGEIDEKSCQQSLIQAYMQKHITLLTLFKLCDATLPKIDTKILPTKQLDNIIEEYAQNKKTLKIAGYSQTLKELRALKAKIGVDSHIPAFHLQLLIAIHRKRSEPSMSSTLNRRLFSHHSTEKSIRSLEKILENSGPGKSK